jgi:hypothetical protein
MRCIENPKKFMGIAWFGGHEWKVLRFGRFMLSASSTSFVVERKCQACGVIHVRHFVEEDELIDMGVTIEEIKKNRDKVFEM